jgi:hypothetical protein
VARLFADENFPLPVVEALRRLGHDVVTMADAGKAGKLLDFEGQAIRIHSRIGVSASPAGQLVRVNRL